MGSKPRKLVGNPSGGKRSRAGYKGDAEPVLRAPDGRYPKCPRCWSARLVDTRVDQVIVCGGLKEVLNVPAQECMVCEFMNSIVPKTATRRLKDRSKLKRRLKHDEVVRMATAMDSHYERLADIDARITRLSADLLDAFRDLESLGDPRETALMDVLGGVPPHLGDVELLAAARKAIRPFTSAWAPGDTKAWVAMVLAALGARNQAAIAQALGISTRALQKRLKKQKNLPKSSTGKPEVD